MPKIPPDQRSPHARTPAKRRTTPKAVTTTAIQGQGDRASGDDDPARRYLSGPAVCRRYGISDMSLWRWLQDDELKFPKPAMRVRDRRYWAEVDLIAWERSYIPHAERTAASAEA